LTETDPFAEAFRRVRDLVAMLRADGHEITTLDLGGGLGVPYGDEEGPIPGPAEYAAIIAQTVGDLGCRLILEPGRLIVANAGVLITRVIYVKEGSTRTFIIVDAGMNDLLRPALYGAHHQIVPVKEPAPGTEWRPVDVVGPVCESSDSFAVERLLPPLARGDLLAIRSVGAYGAVMASFYNGRPLCPEILVTGEDYAVVGERIDHAELMAHQHVPPWLAPAVIRRRASPGDGP
jgi:diaminopimelate decarboxylase